MDAAVELVLARASVLVRVQVGKHALLVKAGGELRLVKEIISVGALVVPYGTHSPHSVATLLITHPGRRFCVRDLEIPGAPQSPGAVGALLLSQRPLAGPGSAPRDQ